MATPGHGHPDQWPAEQVENFGKAVPMERPMAFDLARFEAAQAPILNQVLRELGAGRKRTHWMWFMFPQIAGLGRSPTAQYYAIVSLAEAQAYLAHPVLGRSLLACTGLVNRAAKSGRSAHAIFGSPDDLKFHSSMTLFACTQPGPSPFSKALAQYFGGAPDRTTLDILARSGDQPSVSAGGSSITDST